MLEDLSHCNPFKNHIHQSIDHWKYMMLLVFAILTFS